MIPYGRQDISQDDIDAVVKVLRSDFLTQGPFVPQFERAVAQYCEVQHAIAVNSATSALHVACLALGVGPGDIVWTSPNTFVASANCALYCGAKIDFVDIDKHTYNMSVELLKEKLENAAKNGQLPKVVIPVHYAGQPCDMQTIYLLGQQYGFKIIEDASHAIGAKYDSTIYPTDNKFIAKKKYINQIKVGSCTHSDITVFSFHPVKIITSGEGGMATTKDKFLADRMLQLRTHGIINKNELMSLRAKNEIWNYQQIDLGYNYRMTDIHAALGLSQLNRLDEFINRRHDIANTYNEEFSRLPVITPWQSPQNYSSFHLYPIRINRNKCRKSQKEVYDALWKKNIHANIHYIPVHRHPYYEKMGFKEGEYPEAESFYREVISLPIYSALSEISRKKVVESLVSILK
jgi:UDP-4-amino-4,6-dideoxy-N-acetyl-beta-L-altrosamine transaminase